MSTEDPPPSTTIIATSSSTSSPLGKPLHLLTYDDISQLTREDCRRFLKQKGMRRPSWNKSQAIQQVIMLKSLLEPSPDSDYGSRKVQKGTSADTEISLSAEESVPGHRSDIEKADFLCDNDSAPPPPPPGIGGGTEEAKGQMAIFYSGKVNVYDDIPADKAHALLQLAASPLQFLQEDLYDGNMLQAPSISMGPVMPTPILQTVRMTDSYRLHREESNVLREEISAEGSASRKASVQRYLEKRKERFKSKRKAGAPACLSSFDAYANHQIGNHNLHDQSSRRATCSPPPVRPPNNPNRFS